MRTKQQSSQCKMSWAGMLITLAVIILCSGGQKAAAQQWNTNGNDISNANSGNVGVGTNSPGVKLDILSSVNLIARFGSTAGAHSQVLIDAPATFNSNLTLQRGGVSKWYMGNRASNDRLSFIESTGAIETLTLLQNGNVGIGTTSPGERLVTFGNLLAGNITSHTQMYPIYDSHSPVIMELGYGTATASDTPYPSLVLSKNLTGTNYLAGAIFFANSNITNGNDKRLSGIATFTDGALNSGTLQFYTSTAGTFMERMRITSSGNVGIGTTNPSRKLHLATNSTHSLDGILLTSPDGHFSLTAPSLGQGSYNGITQAGDMGIIYSNGTPGTGSFVIAPWAASGTSGLRMDSNGNVGIGTITPTFKLDVNGEVNATGLRINGTPISTSGSGAVASVFGRTGAVVAANNDYTWAQINKNTSSLADIQTRSAGDLNAGTVPIARLGVSGIPDATTFLRGDNTWAPVTGGSSQWTTTSGTNNISYNAGNVGIGTTTPAAKLDIVGGTYNTGIRITSSSVSGSGLTIKSTDTGGHEFNILATATNITGGTGGLHIFDATANAARMRISPNGDVGIGNTNPGYKLDVSGEINATGLRINGTPISTGGPSGPVTWSQVDKSVSSLADITTRNAGDLNAGTVPIGRIGLSGNAGVSTFLRGDNTWGSVPSSQWTSSSNNISYNAGNVGIGTTSPAVKLHVAGSTRVDGTNGRLYLGTNAVANYRGLEIIEENATTFSIRHHDPSVAWQNIALNPHGGTVGIGTPTPNTSYKLDVNGNTNVTGNINASGTIEAGNIKAKYQDVAEWVESSQALAAGTVVVLDHTRSNQVIASSKAYDTRVAGVISERPGIALGEGGDNKVLVATTGRVRLMVDASKGPIQIGDLLVTSDIPGVAMKSEAINVGGVQIHRPGTLVGKALEPLTKGQGEILVLLSLQ